MSLSNNIIILPDDVISSFSAFQQQYCGEICQTSTPNRLLFRLQISDSDFFGFSLKGRK